MKKETFIKNMKLLQKWSEQSDKFCDILHELDNDAGYVSLYGNQVSWGLELLSRALGLPNEYYTGSDLEYYAYDLEWGEKGADMPIECPDGNKIYLTTIEELCDFVYNAYNVPDVGDNYDVVIKAINESMVALQDILNR